MVIGSRAREESPADAWSDLDIAFATSTPFDYISNDDDEWVSELGDSILTFSEQAPMGNLVEKRVLFHGGYDVDFVPLPVDVLRQGLPPQASGIIHRGWKVVLDKDKLKPLIQSADVAH